MPANTTHGEPSDNPTDAALRNVVDRIDEHGSAQFGASEGGIITSFTFHQTFPASTVAADNSTRLEGASDPADMMMVVPTTCPECGARGSLILHYGPTASAEEADVMSA